MNEEQIKARKQIILDVINSEQYRPMKIKEIAILLQVKKEDRSELKEILDMLLNEGKVSISAKGKYSKPEKQSFVGSFTGHQKGFGFVTIEGEEEDVFIPSDRTNGALNNDIVQITIEKNKSGKRREGAIVKIVEHGNDTVVGTFQKSKNFGFVITDNQRFTKDIFIPREKSMGAVTGHKVVVKITDYGSSEKKPEGAVIEIIGHINDPGTDIMSIVKGADIPSVFPDGVMHQVEDVADEVTSKDIQGRLDVRDWQMVTIDGEDAKDLDDAITLTKEGDIYKLGVHIADVSNYVTEGTPLDAEAIKRGTSVYLVDRVIPMLPHKLSNGICSLNQGTDRLALSCIMDIDDKGTVIGHKIAETVVNVDRRMTYTSVKKILEDNDEAEIEEYKELVPMFKLMQELADILREKRRKRGSIDFDFPETKVKLNEKGHPIDIVPYDRNVATKIIEDFMLVANETVAEDFFWQELPFVYRVHETPDPEKILKLGMFINNFGYSIKTTADGIHPKELQKLLTKIDGTDEEALISRITLRSMKQARYATLSTGHFGLSTKYYCHFTSPIRRYPDLQIHRIIKENLRGGLSPKRISHYEKILSGIADQASKTERRAEEAERDTIKLKKVEYMQDRIGEIYEGVISGITNWGLYVELPNTVEGMVRITNIRDDYYYYDDEKYELVGEVTNKRYKLGEKIKIGVAATDKLQRTIDFEIIDNEEDEEEWKELYGRD